MSKTAEKYKEYYEKGWYNEEVLKNLVNVGKITQEEYDTIVGA